MSIVINKTQPMREAEIAAVDWINQHAGDVEAEVKRAKAAEAALQANIDTEVSRAKGAESTLQGSIDTEVSRAKGAESTLQGSIDTVSAALSTETERANQAEAALQANINAEYTRATGVESGLSQALTDVNAKFPVTTDNIEDKAVTKAKLDDTLDAIIDFVNTIPAFEYGYSESLTIPATSTVSIDITFDKVFEETPQVFTEVMCNTLSNILVSHVTYVDTTKATIKLYNGGVDSVANVTVDYLALAGR